MSAQPIDFAAEGLLDGLDGEERSERLALLERLTAEGVPLHELHRTTAAGTVVFLPADGLIVGPKRYTSAEIVELGGVEEEFLTRARRAMGLPVPEADERAYSDPDLESVRMIHTARAAGISDEQALELLRVLGRG